MRKAIIIVTIACAVMLVMAAAVPRLVPSSTYKDLIERTLSRMLDARVSVDSFDFRLIPYPGYTIRGFKLISTKPPFLGMPAVTAEKVVGSLSFSALLGGEVETNLDVRDALIHYKSDSGISNIGVMLRLEQAPEEGFVPGAIRSIGVQPEPVHTPPPTPPPPGSVPEIKALPAPSLEPQGEAPDEGEALPEIRAPGPTGGLIDPLLVGSAYAADEGEGLEELTIKSVKVVRGRLVIDSEGMVRPVVVEDISLAVTDIDSAKGLSAAVNFSASLGQKAYRNFTGRGRFSFDRGLKRIAADSISAYLMGSQFAADLSASLGSQPAGLDVHVSSPDLRMTSLEGIASMMGWRLPAGFKWDGALGVDARYAGEPESARLSLGVDALSARISFGEAFEKGAQKPFKLSASIDVQPEAFVIYDGKLSMGFEDLEIEGRFGRDGGMMSRFSISGSGLSSQALDVLMPWVAGLIDLSDVSAELVVEGSLASQAALAQGGRLEALKAEALGLDFENVSLAFEREADEIRITSMRSDFSGGSLSGNGGIQVEERPSVDIDIVAHGVDVKGISSIADSLKGEAELVVKVVGLGEDVRELERGLTSSGTFMMEDFEGSIAESHRGFFTEETWSALSKELASKLNGSVTEKLSEGEGSGKDLKVTFESSDRGLKIEGAEWKGPEYGVRLSGSVTAAGAVEGAGEVTIDRTAAKGLVADAGKAKIMLEDDGTIELPVKVSGKLGELELKLSTDSLAERIERRTRQSQRQAEIEKEEEKQREQERKKTMVKKTIKQESQPKKAPAAPAKKAPRASPSKRKRPSRGAPIDNVEDILKVIVGD